MHVYRIEDEQHAEPQEGEYATFEAALSELERRAELPWDEKPNRAPCESWRTCGRRYEVVQYDTSRSPWREIQRRALLEVNATEAKWLDEGQAEESNGDNE